MCGMWCAQHFMVPQPDTERPNRTREKSVKREHSKLTVSLHKKCGFSYNSPKTEIWLESLEQRQIGMEIRDMISGLHSPVLQRDVAGQQEDLQLTETSWAPRRSIFSLAWAPVQPGEWSHLQRMWGLRKNMSKTQWLTADRSVFTYECRDADWNKASTLINLHWPNGPTTSSQM